jgi:hypothetical protein
MRSRWPILALLCVLASLLVPGIASASTASVAETRVWAFDLQDQAHVGVERSLTLELRRGCAPTYDQLASDSLLAARGGRSVLGHYPGYIDKASELGARRFNVPANVWEKMTDAERWGANQKFLDRLIKRGDEVILSTPADQARAGSFFARELEYLQSKGYRLMDGGTRLVPGQ